MADTTGNDCSRFKDGVCIDAGRVYDSCCDRDCLEDLRVCFSPQDQELVDSAVSIRPRSAELIDMSVDVEPVTFNRGFYSVDMICYFLICVEVFPCGGGTSSTICGISVFQKRVILFGSDGSAKVFSSGYVPNGSDVPLPSFGNFPRANVQTVDPIILSAELSGVCPHDTECMCAIPAPVASRVGIDPFRPDGPPPLKKITVTLGMFTVVQLIRNVQMLVPVYDFCVPEKECVSTTDNPCELFKRIRFPVDQFFPPEELCNDNDGCTACDGNS